MISPRSRAAVGLHRLGIALAAAALIGGAALFAEQVAYPTGKTKQWSELTAEEQKFLRDGYEIRMLNEDKAPLPASNDFWRYNVETVAEMPRHVRYTALFVAAIVAALCYAALRTLGWVIDGFTGADR